MALQAGSRILTFALNTVIIRNVSREVLGIAAVQLAFLYHSVIFLCREPARRVCARTLPNDKHAQAKRATLAWACSLVGVVFSALLSLMFFIVSTEEELTSPQYGTAVALTTIAIAIELLTEPFYLALQARLLIGARVGIEAMSLVAKCICQFLLIRVFGFSLLAFPLSQILYSVCLLILFATKFRRSGENGPNPSFSDVNPRIGGGELFLQEDIGLLARFSWQTAQKVVLAHGESVVLKFFQSLGDQGSFSVVSNLGALVVRFLFQPVEEVCFTLFSAQCGKENVTAAAASSCMNVLQLCLVLFFYLSLRLPSFSFPVYFHCTLFSPHFLTFLASRPVISVAATDFDISLLFLTFTFILLLQKLMSIVGLIFVCFGPGYAFILLDLLYGSRISSHGGPSLLSCYCFHVAVVGLNGVSEAFVHASSSPTQLTRFNWLLVCFSLTQMTLSSLAIVFVGTQGLILVGSLVMAVRIGFSIVYISQWCSEHSISFHLQQVTPSPVVLSVFAFSFLGTQFSRIFFPITSALNDWPNTLAHVGVGCAFLASVLITL